MPESVVGRTLNKRFYVESFLASGGMGAVFRVQDLQHKDRFYAMKVLHDDLAENPSAFKRFKREANALKQLKHPNIVRFYGLYLVADLSFILLDLIDGFSLQEVLKKRPGKRLSVPESLAVLKAVGAALGCAHKSGVVHCDVKPGNVLLDRNGKIYLTDFGIARHADSTTTTMANAGAPAYMAPEQIQGRKVNAATDVYALGVMMYEMLTGRRPFLGTELSTGNEHATPSERMRAAHLRVTPQDPRKFNANIPEGLAQTVLHALEKDPRGRFQNTGAFYSAACKGAGISSASVADTIRVPKSTAKKQTAPAVQQKYSNLKGREPAQHRRTSDHEKIPPSASQVSRARRTRKQGGGKFDPMMLIPIGVVMFIIFIGLIISTISRGGGPSIVRQSASGNSSPGSNSSSSSSSSSSESYEAPEVVAPAPTSTPKPKPTSSASGKCWAESTDSGVNIRYSPNGGFKHCCLDSGEDVDVLDYSQGWYLIKRRNADQEGWTSGTYLELQGNCDHIYD